MPSSGIAHVPLLSIFLLIGCTSASLSDDPRRPPDLYDHVAECSVEILVNGSMAGSGWIADADGYIFTALHVLGTPKEKWHVLFPDGRKMPARLVAADVCHDAALLRIDRTGLPFLSFAEKIPPVGSPAFVFGSPIFRHGTMLTGSPARIRPTFEYYDGSYHETIHFHGDTPKGTSGGPWVNREGRVIGLQSAMMTSNNTGVGIAFVSPLPFLKRLLETKTHAANADLGVAFNEIWESNDHVLRHPEPSRGLVVVDVPDESPAKKAGLKTHDLVLQAGETPVVYRDTLLRLVRDARPGDRMTLTVLDGKTKKPGTVTVTLSCMERRWSK